MVFGDQVTTAPWLSIFEGFLSVSVVLFKKNFRDVHSVEYKRSVEPRPNQHETDIREEKEGNSRFEFQDEIYLEEPKVQKEYRLASSSGDMRSRVHLLRLRSEQRHSTRK